jgi:tetratricopeptide (TPR) repeat protein
MSKKKNVKEPDELQKVESALGKSEAFIENNIKQIGIGILIVAIIVAGFVLFRYKYMAPRELKAEEQIYKGEAYFAADSFQIAIDGNGVDFVGFKSIIKQYGMTPTANLAKAYTGISYYKLGNYNTALDYLKDFDADDALVAPAVIGLIGDCYVELGDVNKAISYFEKAAKKADNDIISPIFLKKAAIAYESQGKYDKAIANYTLIKNKYYNSNEAMDIEKYIDRAEYLKK